MPTAHGAVPLRARIRVVPEDFFVEEDLGFAPSGGGEHSFVSIEKRGANTEGVARQLAAFAGIPAKSVSFAGLKDRHALTRQTFSLHLPGKDDPDWEKFCHPDIRILGFTRHHRKLKRGALAGNRFRIVLREVQGDREQAQFRMQAIAARGVPNYFGEQRFGFDGANVTRASAMFAGRRVQRQEQGMLLSAARSHLFNHVLAQRVIAQSWDQPLDGDVWMLQGTHAIFGPEPINDTLRERVKRGDIHPTGAMWGRGELRSAEQVAQLERDVAERYGDLARGLEAAGLEQERRALRVLLSDWQFNWLDGGNLELRFHLPAGSYATSVLHELCHS